MTVWTYYNVILPAVVPVVLVWLILWLIARPQSVMSIVGDGQLCFFAIALMGGMMHDIETLPPLRRAQLAAGAHLDLALPGALVIMLVTTAVFTLITIEKTANLSRARVRLTAASILLTFISIAAVYYWRSRLELFS